MREPCETAPKPCDYHIERAGCVLVCRRAASIRCNIRLALTQHTPRSMDKLVVVFGLFRFRANVRAAVLSRTLTTLWSPYRANMTKAMHAVILLLLGLPWGHRGYCLSAGTGFAGFFCTDRRPGEALEALSGSNPLLGPPSSCEILRRTWRRGVRLGTIFLNNYQDTHANTTYVFDFTYRNSTPHTS